MGKFKLRYGFLVAAITSAFLAAAGGCGGGGGSAAPATADPGTTAGVIVDGYVIGAIVTLDVNDDRVFDERDISVSVGADGFYSFPGRGQHMVRATGGVDASTYAPFVGEMKAAPGASVLSPLTTLVLAEVESTLPTPVPGTASPVITSTVTTAETTLKAKLGIPAGINLSATDPVAAVRANANDASVATLMQQTVAVQVLMQQATAAVAAASGVITPTAAQLTAIYKQATRAISTALAATTAPTDLSSASSAFASSVVGNAVANAQADPAVIAALPPAARTALANLAPASVAAVAAATISAQVKAVAAASAATLAAPAPSSGSSANPALAAFTNVSLQVALAQIASTGLLSTTAATATANSPTALQDLANSVITVLTNGGGAAAGTVADSINQQVTATAAALPGLGLQAVDPTAIAAALTTASAAVTKALADGASTVGGATTTTTAPTTTTASATTTTAAAVSTTSSLAATSTTAATTTSSAATTTTVPPTTTSAAATTTTASSTSSTSSASTTATSTTSTTSTTTTAASTTTTTAGYFAISGDTLTFDNVACSFSSFTGSGCTTVNPASAVSKVVSFTMVPTGSPSPGATTSSGNTKLFFRVAGVSPDTRVLEIGIDSINLGYAGGVLSVSVPASARLYLYGYGSNGTTATATLVNALNQAVSITGNSTFSLNVNQVLTTVTNNFASPFSALSSKSGSFNVEFIIGANVPLRRASGSELASDTKSMTAVNSGSFSISGPALTGKYVVTNSNSAPTASAFSFPAIGGAAKTVNWKTTSGANDADGDAMTASVTTDGTKGTCVVAGDNVTFTPAANKSGSDTCTLRIVDGNGGTKDIVATEPSINTLPALTISGQAGYLNNWVSGSAGGGGKIFGASGYPDTRSGTITFPSAVTVVSLTATGGGVGVGSSGGGTTSITVNATMGSATDDVIVLVVENAAGDQFTISQKVTQF